MKEHRMITIIIIVVEFELIGKYKKKRSNIFLFILCCLYLLSFGPFHPSPSSVSLSTLEECQKSRGERREKLAPPFLFSTVSLMGKRLEANEPFHLYLSLPHSTLPFWGSVTTKDSRWNNLKV